MKDLCDSRTGRKTALLPPSLDSSSLWHCLCSTRLSCHCLLLRGRGRGEERVGDEVLEGDAVLGVPLEQVVEQVGELGGGAAWNPRGKSGISLIELLQSLGETVLKTDLLNKWYQ